MIVDLQRAAKDGDSAAIVAIVGMYRSQIRAMAWKLDAGRFLFDDLQTWGLVGLLDAIQYNDPEKGLDLAPLVGRFARFRMYDFLKKEKRHKAYHALIEDMKTINDEGVETNFDPQTRDVGPDRIAMLLEECASRLRLSQMRAYYRRHRLRLRNYKAKYRSANRESLRRAERERYLKKKLALKAAAAKC